MTTETVAASFALPDCIQRYEAQLAVQAYLKRDISQLKKQVEHYLQQVPTQSLPMEYGRIKLQKRSQRAPITQAYLEACLATYVQRHTKITDAEARQFGKGAATFAFNERPQTHAITLFRYVSKRKGGSENQHILL